MSDKIIAVTGHQHGKVKDSVELETLFQRTFVEVEPEKVIVGMACGTDLIAGLAAIKTCFPVIAVVPWAGHQASSYISGCEQCVAHYHFVRHFAQKVIVLNDAQQYPGPQAFHTRNEYMVDHATHLLAYYDEKPGSGTAATVKYADGKIPMRNLYGKTI